MKFYPCNKAVSLYFPRKYHLRGHLHTNDEEKESKLECISIKFDNDSYDDFLAYKQKNPIQGFFSTYELEVEQIRVSRWLWFFQKGTQTIYKILSINIHEGRFCAAK